MRVWVVSRNGAPCAVFSTAGRAKEYVDGSGRASAHDVRWFVLDADDDRHVRRLR
jgi:hypothetical protein